MSPMYATAVMLLMAAEGSMANDDLVAEEAGALRDAQGAPGEDEVSGEGAGDDGAVKD